MSARSLLNAPQPSPQPSDGKKVWDLVISDVLRAAREREHFRAREKPRWLSALLREMRERDRFGAAKYGQRLTCGDGRDSLVDAFQEALDLTVYLRKHLEEKWWVSDAVLACYRSSLRLLCDFRAALYQRDGR